MIDGAFSLADIRFIVALGAIFEEHGWTPLSLNRLKELLRDRGIPVGNGMTREINRLEVRIGGHTNRGKLLLIRNKNASTMTAAGKEILAKMRHILRTIDEVETSVESGRSLIRVGLTNSLATNMFPRVLKESFFLTSFPKVDLEIVEGEPHELVGMLQSRVDFAVGPKDLTNGFQSTPLCQWKRVLLYNRNVKYNFDYSLNPPIETLREWLRTEVLLLPATRIIPKIDRFLKPMTTGTRITVPQAALRRVWVERGLGVAISYEEKRSVSNLGDPTGSLGSIDLSSVLGTTEMHLYQRQDQEPTAATKALIDSISTIFRREQFDEFSRGIA